MEAQPSHARMGQEQGRHAAKRPQRRYAIGASGGDESQTSQHETQVPQGEHL